MKNVGEELRRWPFKDGEGPAARGEEKPEFETRNPKAETHCAKRSIGIRYEELELQSPLSHDIFLDFIEIIPYNDAKCQINKTSLPV
jgi:hypothetical protein